jgi:hypothetical protein
METSRRREDTAYREAVLHIRDYREARARGVVAMASYKATVIFEVHEDEEKDGIICKITEYGVFRESSG